MYNDGAEHCSALMMADAMGLPFARVVSCSFSLWVRGT